MNYHLDFFKRLMVNAFVLALAISGLHAQEGDYTVRIKQPAVDTLKTCPGKSIVFMAEAQNADFSTFDPNQVTFTWDFGYNGQVKTGQNVTFEYPEGGHYVVKLHVTGNSGPSALNVPQLHVFVGMRPSFYWTRADHASICSGDEIGLSGSVEPIPWTRDSFQFENSFALADYVWNGSGIVTDHNGIARVNPPLDKGNQNYIFRVMDNFGCYSDTTITLYGVYASFTVDPMNGEAPLDLNMKIDSSSNGGAENNITYDFEFFENSDTTNLLTTSNLNFILERPGEYTGRVVAKYQQCRNVYTLDNYIRVDSSLLEIPNVFTPNEDGANDYFQVKALSLKSFSGKIINRWGRVVYEWTDPKTLEKGWNGRYMNDGAPEPAGTYYYIISATGYDDKVYKGKIDEKMYYGFLTLIR